jgi:hypothetical protein
MKKIFRRSSLLMLMLVLGLTTMITFAQQGNVNFSGNWKLNEAKSEMGQGRMRMGASSMIVKQNGNNLSVERRSVRQDGTANTTEEKFTLDGKVNVNTGAMNRQSSSTVAWTGRSLTFQSSQRFERNGQTTEMKSSEVWSLSPDASTLTIDYTTTTQQGEMKRKLVYNK